MTAPALLLPIILGLTVATMLAALIHLLTGGPLRSLLTLWLRFLDPRLFDPGLALLGGLPLLFAGLGVLLLRARAARLARARLHQGRDYGSRLLDAAAPSKMRADVARIMTELGNRSKNSQTATNA